MLGKYVVPELQLQPKVATVNGPVSQMGGLFIQYSLCKTIQN